MKLSLKKSQFLTGLRLGYLFVCHFGEVDGLSGYQLWVGYFWAGNMEEFLKLST
jgi:hypothetical protein